MKTFKNVESIPEDEFNSILERFDLKDNQAINYEKFASIINQYRSKEKLSENALFNFFDLNQDHQISMDELKLAMQRLDFKLTDEELQLMMRFADTDQDGSDKFPFFIYHLFIFIYFLKEKLTLRNLNGRLQNII